jgi:hypothetical protein
MTTFTRIILALAAATAFTACAAEPGDPEQPQGIGLAQVWEIDANDAAQASLYLAPTSGEVMVLTDPTRDDGSAGICACADETCQHEELQDAFGCGVCAAVNCGDELVGGCVFCPGVHRALDGKQGGQAW